LITISYIADYFNLTQSDAKFLARVLIHKGILRKVGMNKPVNSKAIKGEYTYSVDKRELEVFIETLKMGLYNVE